MLNLPRRPADFERLFDEFFQGAPWSPVRQGAAPLALDVHRSEDQIVVEASVPGFKPEEVEIHVEDTALTITASHQQEQTHRGAECVRHERYWGSFYRQVILPPGVTGEQANASFKNGVLTITVPLEKKPGPHRIPISSQAEPEGIPAEEQTEPVRRPGEGGMPEQDMRSGESGSPGGG
jgi:HSP20 family protein